MLSIIDEMAQTARHYWWMIALRGLIAIIFGLIALFAPKIALLAIIFVFATYVIIDGLMTAYVAIQERSVLSRWGWLLAEGILAIVFGILAIAWPRETALILLFLVAIWAIVRGIVEIGAAFQLREVIGQEWALVLGGVLSVLFGVLLIVFPGAGLLSVLWVLGLYAIVFGVLMVIRSFQLRSLAIRVSNRIAGI